MNELYIVGPFPPPRHGASSVNEGIRLEAEKAGIEVVTLNTAVRSLDRSLFSRCRRPWRIASALWTLGVGAGKPRGCSAYLSVSGGWGVLYEALIAGVARLRGMRLVLHHHSFSYLDRFAWRMSLLARVAGKDCLHVVLCPGMGRLLSLRYGAALRSLVLSNAVFVADAPRERLDACRAIGFLSNISREKGIGDVLALAGRARREGSALRFVVAGPFEDASMEAEFREASTGLGNVSYLGPVFGEDKARFFQSIDAFVFPTRYENEAEPLVVLEALAAGCPVITRDRGCLSSMVGPDCGLVLPRDGDFCGPAWEQLKRWEARGLAFGDLQHSAIAFFRLRKAEARLACQALLDHVRQRDRIPVANRPP